MTEPTVSSYLVEGMSCEHCRASVSEEVGALAGVDEVAVDLESGRLEISGGGVGEEQVRAAVEKAGYRLATT